MCYGTTATLVVTLLSVSSALAQGWRTQRVHETFYAEGASAGDVDGDGNVDIVAGPLWFRGPGFRESFEITTARQFPIASYSDQFFSHVFDANDDGANDVLVLGFPGKPARLYLNPGHEALEDRWAMKEVADIIDNESPAIVDIVRGGRPEIVCGRGSQYGFYSAGKDVTKPWSWMPITRPGACHGKFAHALGVGDVNGDGRLDVLDKTYWWEQPETLDQRTLWKRHIWASDEYGQGGAQIRVDDIDGDGDSDIVTSLNAHGFGLAWFEQTSDESFVRHTIMSESSTDNDYGVVFSQLHAVELIDVDGDGLKDIVTGKRWMAHHGKDLGGLQEPVLYWFRCVRDDQGVSFIPYLVGRDSGVGVDVLVTDLNADSRLDVVSSSKRGLSIHFQNDNVITSKPQTWKQIAGSDQATYVDGFSPIEAAKNTIVSVGFTVDLIAAEPELTQPMAMCFDARGRIWVIEGHTYPAKAPEGEGRDRIVIFEDSDADGRFETRKTFAEGLNLASGIEVGFGGVWIGAAPQLLFIPDANHDDTPDGKPHVLLDGWGYHDTHETLNSFTWGPDGWLYGCQGVFTHSNVGKPGAPNDQRTKMNAGVWRYHPTQHRFEVFSHGTSNPWGVDFDDRGDWFISACVIPHLYHIQKGGRFQRQAGQHFNPYTYDDIKTIADHLHYVGSIRDHAYWGDNKTTMPVAPIGTSMLGGGHAHCGLAVYNAEVFPPEYHGDLFFHNLHGHRVVRETLEHDGSGYIGKHRPDFARSGDHKQVGVSIMVGPDGAIYTSDWHDVQTCHNGTPEVWDRTDGRLFRIRYGDVKPQKFDLWAESDEQLVARLQSDNAFFARQAQRILQERAAAGVLRVSEVSANLDKLVSGGMLQRDRLRALWAKWCIGAVDEATLNALMGDADEYVRGWAVHFVGERVARGAESSSGQRLADLAQSDPSPVVRRYLASVLQELPNDQRWSIIEGLTSHAIDQNDRNIPFLVWYGMEPLVGEQPDRAYEIAVNSEWGGLRRFSVRRITVTPEGREMLVARLENPAERGNHLMILEELYAAATSRGGVEMPQQWPEAFRQLVKAPLPRVAQLTRAVAVQFGDEGVFPFFRAILSDTGKSKRQRLEALTALKTAKDAELPAQVYRLLDDQDVSAAAVAALSQFNDPETADELLRRISEFDESTRTAALSTLASRAESADKLVAAMEAGSVAPSSVPAFIVRQTVTLGRKELNARLEEVWGQISESDADKLALYRKYRAILRPAAITNADASRGRVLYSANCGNCHKLFDSGGDIGPNITGANRSKVDYWLENVLEPNSLVGKDYQVTTFVTVDGRVISGVLEAENDDALTVQTATETVVVRRADIEEATPSKVSLMPEGQMQPMTNQQVLDLFKYLMGPSQVPLPDRNQLDAEVEQ